MENMMSFSPVFEGENMIQKYVSKNSVNWIDVECYKQDNNVGNLEVRALYKRSMKFLNYTRKLVHKMKGII